jgi:hypothetical protein
MYVYDIFSLPEDVCPAENVMVLNTMFREDTVTLSVNSGIA